VPTVADTTLTREVIRDLSPENGNSRAGDPTLIGKDHWNAEVHRNLGRDRAGKWANVA
jgi:hypothetical protein